MKYKSLKERLDGPPDMRKCPGTPVRPDCQNITDWRFGPNCNDCLWAMVESGTVGGG